MEQEQDPLWYKDAIIYEWHVKAFCDMFLAEANQWSEDVREHLGNGNERCMAYHFPLMPRLYMAIAQKDRHPITEIMEQTPEFQITDSGVAWRIVRTPGD